MISTTCTLRVRYAETDPMKYVYYGNYATYFEVARVELFGVSECHMMRLKTWNLASGFGV